MKHYKQWVGKATLFGLILSTLFPAGLQAEIDRSCSSPDRLCCSKKVVKAKRVITDELKVKDKADVCGDLCVGNDVEICGDLKVKGKIKGDKCPKDCDVECADFLVIGVGAAGATLCRQLTNSKKHSVIAFEAGDNNNTDLPIQDPALHLTLLTQFFPQYFWQGEGIPQQQLAGQSLKWTNGRLLAGGSAINGLQVLRGTVSVFEEFEALLGPDWAVDKVFARYKALETYTGPLGPGPNTRGDNGCWSNVALPFNPTEDSEYLLGAMENVTGLAEVIDYNNPETPIGPHFRWQLQEQPNNNFFRESSATAFLGPDVMTPEGIGLNGRKLRVHLNSTVLSLIWHKNKVIGVKYSQGGVCHKAFAKKEVILCAGFRSAAFLQREGIGPESVLNDAGVPVRVANEHVGRHLLNHVLTPASVFITPGADFTPAGEPYSYESPGAFLPAIPGGDTREMQWITTPGSQFGAPGLLFFIQLQMLPLSEGTIEIQNDDPFKIPLVNQNYLSNPSDLQTFIDGYRNFILDLDDYFAANPAPNGETWELIDPLPAVINDDQALTALIKAGLQQAHHWQSSCRMGNDIASAVVDARGRVFGVDCLRVADDSIWPDSIDGNLCTPAVLIGWTIAEFLNEEYDC